jgi:hypothetical protein
MSAADYYRLGITPAGPICQCSLIGAAKVCTRDARRCGVLLFPAIPGTGVMVFSAFRSQLIPLISMLLSALPWLSVSPAAVTERGMQLNGKRFAKHVSRDLGVPCICRRFSNNLEVRKEFVEIFWQANKSTAACLSGGPFLLLHRHAESLQVYTK